MRSNEPSLKVIERAYVTDRVRHTKLTATEAREEFKRGIFEVERAAAEKAWDEGEAAGYEDALASQRDIGPHETARNPYRREEK